MIFVLTEFVDIWLREVGDIELQTVRQVVVDPLGDLLQIADLPTTQGRTHNTVGLCSRRAITLGLPYWETRDLVRPRDGRAVGNVRLSQVT